MTSTFKFALSIKNKLLLFPFRFPYLFILIRRASAAKKESRVAQFFSAPSHPFESRRAIQNASNHRATHFRRRLSSFHHFQFACSIFSFVLCPHSHFSFAFAGRQHMFSATKFTPFSAFLQSNQTNQFSTSSYLLLSPS